MEVDMSDFRERLKAAISSSKYNGSARALSIDAGLGERSIANMLGNTAMDDSKSGPGLFSMARVADCLGISLDWLAGRDLATPSISEGDKQFNMSLARFSTTSAGQFTQGNQPPTPQAMLRLYVRGGGQLEAFSKVIQYCDRYHCPDPDTDAVSVLAVGESSLASLTMGASDPSILQIALNTVPDPVFRAKLINDHQETMRRGSLCTVEELNVQMPNKPVRVKMDYIRVLLHVSDRNGHQSILAFAAHIA
jgi:hypothetical protein